MCTLLAFFPVKRIETLCKFLRSSLQFSIISPTSRKFMLSPQIALPVIWESDSIVITSSCRCISLIYDKASRTSTASASWTPTASTSQTDTSPRVYALWLPWMCPHGFSSPFLLKKSWHQGNAVKTLEWPFFHPTLSYFSNTKYPIEILTSLSVFAELRCCSNYSWAISTWLQSYTKFIWF